MVEENKKMWFLLHMHMVWPCYFMLIKCKAWYFFLRGKLWSLRIWPNFKHNCMKGHEFPLTEFIFFSNLPLLQIIISFSKRMPSQPWLMGVCAKYKELFLSADLLAVYEINLTLHLPFCGGVVLGKQIYTIQKCRLLKNVIPCSLMCSYLFHIHWQAGNHKEDDSMCPGPQVDTSGCNLACGVELVHPHPLNSTMRNDHPSWIRSNMLCLITAHSSCHWVVWLLQT